MYKNDNPGFLSFVVISFFSFLKSFLCTLCNSNTICLEYFHDIWWKCQLPFLLLSLSPFVIYDSDYALILFPLCKLNTLWNILMILGSNVE